MPIYTGRPHRPGSQLQSQLNFLAQHRLTVADESKLVPLLDELSSKLGVIETARLIVQCPLLFDAHRPQWQQTKAQIANKLCAILSSDDLNSKLLESSSEMQNVQLTQPARAYLEDLAKQSFKPEQYWQDPHHGKVLKNIVKSYASKPSEALKVLAERAVQCLSKLIEPGNSLNIEGPLVELITLIWKTDETLKKSFGDIMKKDVFPHLGTFWQRVQDREISRANLQKILQDEEAAKELLYMGVKYKEKIQNSHAADACKGRSEDEVKQYLLQDLRGLKAEWESASKLKACFETVSSWCATQQGSCSVRVGEDDVVTLRSFKVSLEEASNRLRLHPWQVAVLKPLLEQELQTRCREPSWLLKWHIRPEEAAAELSQFLDRMLFMDEASSQGLGAEIYNASTRSSGFNAHGEVAKLQSLVACARGSIQTELALGNMPDNMRMGDLPKLGRLIEDSGSLDQLLQHFETSGSIWERCLREANALILRDQLTELMELLERLQLHKVLEELRVLAVN